MAPSLVHTKLQIVCYKKVQFRGYIRLFISSAQWMMKSGFGFVKMYFNYYKLMTTLEKLHKYVWKLTLGLIVAFTFKKSIKTL